MVVDVLLLIADNNGSIVKVRYCENAIGAAIEHGEYIIVIVSIPGRTHRFFNIGYLNIEVKKYVKARICNLSLTNDLRVVGLVHSSNETSNDRGAKELAYGRFFSDTW